MLPSKSLKRASLIVFFDINFDIINSWASINSLNLSRELQTIISDVIFEISLIIELDALFLLYLSISEIEFCFLFK